jgi:hypothetical protein
MPEHALYKYGNAGEPERLIGQVGNVQTGIELNNIKLSYPRLGLPARIVGINLNLEINPFRFNSAVNQRLSAVI